MPARMLRTIAVVAVCFSDGAFAAERNSHAAPAAPYKAKRLSTPRTTQSLLNIPGQTTVLTQANARRHERHEHQGRLALNRGGDGWKIRP